VRGIETPDGGIGGRRFDAFDHATRLGSAGLGLRLRHCEQRKASNAAHITTSPISRRLRVIAAKFRLRPVALWRRKRDIARLPRRGAI
jgi:hypothetical protein